MTERGTLPPKQDTKSVRGVDADLLYERVLDALGDRSGYYVVVGCERVGPMTADQAYGLWEETMQGEVKYFDGRSLLNPDGSA